MLAAQKSIEVWSDDNNCGVVDLPPYLNTDELGVTEEQVSTRSLRGLVPDALLDKFEFWRTGPHTIYGYPVHESDENTVIALSMSKANSSDGWCAIVRRMEAMYSVTEADDERSCAASSPMTLLNLLEAPRIARGDENRGGRLLRLLATTFSRLDDLSHVLVWSSSLGEKKNDECHVTKIELPRLQMSFETKPGPDGKIRLYSCDYSGN